jgi:type II secretory pathway pseudopilin PulG
MRCTVNPFLHLSGFTLAEALAALAFLAIVIPVAVEGVRVASLAGQVAERKAAASRVAERLLNEMIATRQWQQSSGGGTVTESRHEYRWQLKNQTWDQDAMRLVVMEVAYQVQGHDYSVRLSTLADSTQ